MELNFTKDGSGYVAIAEVNDDYNVHLEFNSLSGVVVSQKTSGNKYAVVHASNTMVVDDDFDGIVWPKQVRIETSEMPSVAIITEAQ